MILPNSRRIYLLSLLALLLFLAASPLIIKETVKEHPGTFLFIKTCYGTICHQNPAKCPGGVSFLCYRCLGIYSGVWIALLLSLFSPLPGLNNNLRILLITAAALLVTDVIFHNFGVYNYSAFAAATTGLIFGFSLLQFITNYH